MQPLILDWEAAAAAGPTLAGGKGWQLARLATLGVRVPDGFVVTADTDAAALASVLEAELARRGWLQTALAVRSSAAHEDSGRASFAGIHRSCLNVIGPAAACAAIGSVRASANEAPAQAYRQRLGLAAEAAAMAVVVMPLLPAVASGIAFTCDPLTGRDDQIVIHAHWGLGESLVGGLAQGDEYRLQEDSVDDRLRLIATRPGSKAQETLPRDGGGTELRPTDPQRAARTVLDAEQVHALADMARDAAAALDFASTGHDIEWVWDGTDFWIVQARPVTAHGRHTYPELAAQPALWSRGNAREVLPEPLSALDWGLSRRMVNRMLTRSYELVGHASLPGAQRSALFHGRLYLEASLLQWEAYAVFGVAPTAMNAMLGGHQPEIAVPSAGWRQRLAWARYTLRYLRRAPKMRRQGVAELDLAHARASQWRCEALPTDPREIAQRLRQYFAAVRGADAIFYLQSSASGTLINLVALLERYRPGEGHTLAACLMAGGEASVTAAQGHELLELARMAADEPAALAWLRSTDREARDWQDALPPSSPFRRAFADFLERYGHRAVAETYFRTPRWREQPAYLLDTVLALIGTDPGVVRARQRDAADAAWQRLRPALPFWLRPLVGKLVRIAGTESNHREAARSALMAYLEVARRGVLAIGTRLHHENMLDTADDIFHLTFTEICAVLDRRLVPAAAARRARERRARMIEWSAQPEPDVLILHTASGAAAPEPTVASAAPGRDRIDGEWCGTAVGGGRASGRACVARTPQDGMAIAPGDVLVAPATDPAWTPLFLKAGALVMETGGYMSHAAIVAREFGIPAVVNLPGIVDQIRSGETLDVDAIASIVRRRVPAAEAA